MLAGPFHDPERAEQLVVMVAAMADEYLIYYETEERVLRWDRFGIRRLPHGRVIEQVPMFSASLVEALVPLFDDLL